VLNKLEVYFEPKNLTTGENNEGSHAGKPYRLLQRFSDEAS